MAMDRSFMPALKEEDHEIRLPGRPVGEGAHPRAAFRRPHPRRNRSGRGYLRPRSEGVIEPKTVWLREKPGTLLPGGRVLPVTALSASGGDRDKVTFRVLWVRRTRAYTRRLAGPGADGSSARGIHREFTLGDDALPRPRHRLCNSELTGRSDPRRAGRVVQK